MTGKSECDLALGPPAIDRLFVSRVLGSSARKSWRQSPVLPAIIGLLILLFAFGPAFEEPASQMDEGTLLVYPEQLLHGKLPYRDFETFYGPANPALLAGVYAITGVNLFVERSVGLLYRCAIVLAFFAIGRRWGTAAGCGCLLVSGLLLVPTHLLAFAWLGALAFALWSLWLAREPGGSARCFGSGLCAGLALAFRVDLGPAMILSTLPLLFPMSWGERRKYFAGVMIGLLSLAAVTFLVGIGPLAENLFLMPVLYSGPGRHLPLQTADPCLRHLFFLHLLAVVLNIAAAITLLRAKTRDNRGRLLLAIALLGLGLTHQAAQRLDLTHLLFVAFVSFGILPVSLAVLAARWQKITPNYMTTLGACVLVIAVIEGVAPELTIVVRSAFEAGFNRSAPSSCLEINGRPFLLRNEQNVRCVLRVLYRLDTLSKSGERFFVGPADLRRTNYCDTYLYYMMPKLIPATYFLEMNPLAANRPGSRLAADVASADWLILNRAWDPWSEPNASVDYGSSVPNEVIQRDFELLLDSEGYLLYRRKEEHGVAPAAWVGRSAGANLASERGYGTLRGLREFARAD